MGLEFDSIGDWEIGVYALIFCFKNSKLGGFCDDTMKETGLELCL